LSKAFIVKSNLVVTKRITIESLVLNFVVTKRDTVERLLLNQALLLQKALP